jgi:hypothetical protein
VTGWNGRPSGARAERSEEWGDVTGWNGRPSGARAERSEEWGEGRSFYSQGPVATSAVACWPVRAASPTSPAVSA